MKTLQRKIGDLIFEVSSFIGYKRTKPHWSLSKEIEIQKKWLTEKMNQDSDLLYRSLIESCPSLIESIRDECIRQSEELLTERIRLKFKQVQQEGSLLKIDRYCVRVTLTGSELYRIFKIIKK